VQLHSLLKFAIAQIVLLQKFWRDFSRNWLAQAEQNEEETGKALLFLVNFPCQIMHSACFLGSTGLR
jgi:hypothetical protein